MPCLRVVVSAATIPPDSPRRFECDWCVDADTPRPSSKGTIHSQGLDARERPLEFGGIAETRSVSDFVLFPFEPCHRFLFRPLCRCYRGFFFVFFFLLLTVVSRPAISRADRRCTRLARDVCCDVECACPHGEMYISRGMRALSR